MVLDLLSAAPVELVVMHNEELIGTPELNSDVDIALSVPVSEVLALLEPRLKELGIIPAVIWTYDVGGGASVFFTSRDGMVGAQIDILHDLKGDGRYGLRSDEMLARRQQGSRYQVPDRLDELLYELIKSHIKGRMRQVEVSRGRLKSDFTIEEISSRADQLFEPPVAKVVRRILRNERGRAPFRARRWFKSLIRLGNRLRYPIGFWIEICGPSDKSEPLAIELRERFGSWLVASAASARPRRGLGVLYWWLTRVSPVRMRAGLFVSWSERSNKRLQPDLTLKPSESSSLAEQIVAGMGNRAWR